MQYKNPIIRGFNPDPSICRVGEDFYLVTSSFEYFPGIPVYHSKDLVNWKQIGNCIERQEQLPLGKAKSSGGVWAPTMRYEEGVFYVTATFDGMGNFIVTSKDPATGWSDPMWMDFDGIDPSILFDAGEMYYCANDIGERMLKWGGEGISLARMDRTTGKVIGDIKRIWQGAGGGWIESPHIYHIGDYYYIMVAEGGTNINHTIVVGRSRDIWGPYENCPQNPILTNRNDTSKQVACSGHGDLVEDGRGNWWMVHLGTRPVQGMSNLGRETFLMPVTWEEGWPVIGKNKMCHLQEEGPLWAPQRIENEWSYDFSGKEMGLQWLYRRLPETDRYVMREGALCLQASEIKLSDSWGSPTFIALRQMDQVFEAKAEISFACVNDADKAGFVVYLSENFFYRIGKMRENGQDYIFVERKMADLEVIVYKQEIAVDKLEFRVVSDGQSYDFYYKAGGEEILAASAPTRFLSCELAGKCFTGVLNGVFAECEKEGAVLKLERISLKRLL